MARFNPYRISALCYQVALELGETEEGVVTSNGSPLTETDTNRTEAANFWNGGTFFTLADSQTESAGYAAEITAFASGVFTLKLGNTWDPLKAGDYYAVASPKWSIFKYVAAVNAAIRSMGKILYTRTGDITTAASQTEYPLVEQADEADLPTLIAADAELKRVRIQGITDDSNNNLWREIDIPWHVRKGGVGSMSTLIFDWQPPTGKALELMFVGQHPTLTRPGSNQAASAHNDTWIQLDEGIPFRLVVLKAALHLLQQKRGRHFNHPRIAALTSEIKEMLEQTKREQAPLKLDDEPQLFNLLNRASYYSHHRNTQHIP